MRKVTVGPAVILAAASALLLPATAAGQSSETTGWLVQTRTWTETRAPRRPTRRARAVIRQTPAGDVVLEQVQVADAAEPGPFIPPAYYNYPPSPDCDPVDIVAVARLHDLGADEETESQTAEVAQQAARPSSAASRWKRVARELGSLFRPKSSAASVAPEDVDVSELLSREFLIPVQGVDAERLRDSFLASRGRFAKHLAIDIGAPRGTPVLATTDGEIVRIAREARGGKAIYQKDSTGRYVLFYCHLSAFADGMQPGEKVRKGEVIGYVGATGHVVGGPHLHFSITRVPNDDSNFRNGLAINPYLLFLGGVP